MNGKHDLLCACDGCRVSRARAATSIREWTPEEARMSWAGQAVAVLCPIGCGAVIELGGVHMCPDLEVNKLKARVKELEVQLAEAKAVLREVEWTDDQCPSCRGWEPHEINSGMVVIGHAPDCRLAKALEVGG